MKLTSFHVRVFRNVVDSGEIKVVGNTCLVGKNEAGKTACIEALHRLNPAKAASFDLLDDYPRWLKKEHELTGEITDATPFTATFELTDDDVADIEDEFCAGVLKSKEIVASRKYDAEIELQVQIDFNAFIKWFNDKYATSIAKKIKATNSEELMKAFGSLSAEITPDTNEPTDDAREAKQAKVELEKILKNNSSLTAALNSHLLPLLPKTFYFSVYSQLRGRYNFNEVFPAIAKGSNDEQIQTAADFLKLAKITAESVQAVNFEESNAELEAVSSLLTKRVKDNWKQNPHLRLQVKIESVQNQQGNMDRFLQFRVEDTRHDFTSRLDRRSTGFQWFVSFMASFFEFEAEKNIILLLDEPGLSLHARAQLDLLDSIDKNLTKNRQVIYTTHSPFMVRTEALDRIRIVEDKGPEHGSTVTNDAGTTSDPDTLFPLQAALGYDIAQSLFIGNRNILLEGVSDFIYLSVMSSHLGAMGRANVPSNARLLPAGGATNIPTFLALLGRSLDIVVLLDGNAQRQKIDNAIADGCLKKANVLSIDQFSAVKGADIEDLFEPDEYLAIYNKAFSKSVKISSLKGTDRIVKRIERVEGEFDHGRVAAYFLGNQHVFVGKLSADTIQRFEDTIVAMVKALPPAS
jgi:predicted ATP-dependent endonuclease of OLD family